MAFQRGDVVLIPFLYTDLTATKTRPAIVISSTVYQAARSELLLAYVSSQIGKATPPIDYLLHDWKQAGLPKPSFVRPKVAAIEPRLIVHQIGQLSLRDIEEVDRRLRLAMALTASAVNDIVQEIDFLKQPPTVVQTLVQRCRSFDAINVGAVSNRTSHEDPYVSLENDGVINACAATSSTYHHPSELA